jgi:hypothetical protein
MSCGGQSISFNKLQQVYDGTARYPVVLLNGQPRAADYICREINQSSSPTIFSNIPQTLALSYISWPFSATKTSALGNLIIPAGTARVADHVEVVMVTWATAAQYPALAALDASGYRHPLTATLYNLQTSQNGTTTLSVLEQSTTQIQIPWRPATLPNGSPYPYNGYAFKALIPMSAGITVSQNCVIAIGFNTQSAGASPLGTPGPYNTLNLAWSSADPIVGTDPDKNAVFWETEGASYYPVNDLNGPGSPMLRLAARNTALTQPALLAATQPVNAGTYHVRARISPENFVANATLTIAQAPAQILLSGVTRSVGAPTTGASVTTVPSGLSASVTYAGSPLVPANLGRYTLAAQINERNYHGSITGEFHRTGLTYAEWHQQQFGSAGNISGTGNSDPDSDGRPNLVEYAIGTNPRLADSPVEFSRESDQMKLLFRRRREMTAVTLSVESSSNLTNWQPVESTLELSEDLWETRAIRSSANHGFFRFRTNAN